MNLIRFILISLLILTSNIKADIQEKAKIIISNGRKKELCRLPSPPNVKDAG
jgi:hypothetical protein